MVLAIPREFTAGDTVQWVDCFPAYPSSQFNLSYSIRGSSALDLPSISNGSTFTTTISAIQSAPLVSGRYFYQAYLTKLATGDRQNVGQGQVRVNQNLATLTAPYDGSTYAQRTLLAIQNTITAKLEGGAVMEYRIGNRLVKNFTLKELSDMEIYYRGLVLKEEVDRGDRPNFENLYIGFNRFQ